MFAVFGMTRTFAYNQVKKKTEAWHKEEKRPLTLEEYSALLKHKTDQLLNSGKEVQLSPVYSNRAEAEQFLSLAQADQGKNLKIKAKKANGFDNVKKVQLTKWEAA